MLRRQQIPCRVHAQRRPRCGLAALQQPGADPAAPLAQAKIFRSPEDVLYQGINGANSAANSAGALQSGGRAAAGGRPTSTFGTGERNVLIFACTLLHHV